MEIPSILAVRGDPNPEAALQTIAHHVGQLGRVFPLTLPPLKVGALDTLLQIADSIGKIDHMAEQVVHRLEKQLYELQKNEDVPRVKGSLLISVRTTERIFTLLLRSHGRGTISLPVGR